MSLKPKEVNFDATWDKLKTTIKSVLQMETVQHKIWTECFSDVYSLCVAFPESLADRLYEEVKMLLSGHVSNLHNEVNEAGEESILSIYNNHWVQFSKGAKYLDNLFSYLNQQHIQKQRYSEADQKYGHLTVDFNESHMEIGELAFEIWKENLIKAVECRLVDVLLGCIKADRLGEGLIAPVSTVRGVIHSFVDVCVYKKKNTFMLYDTVFESSLLQQTAEFYRAESASVLQEMDLSQYMERVLARKQEEMLRCTKFLPPSCHQKVEKRVHAELVENHLPVIQGEADKLVSEERSIDLSNMYQLLRPVPGGLKPLVECIQGHIKQKGLDAVQQLQGDNLATNFVESLLSVHNKYSDLVNEMFNRDQMFQEALHKAFEGVVNAKLAKNAPKSPEIIAKYCDTLLKKSTKGLSESEVDDRLCNTIVIFKYIEDKDVFQKFYSRHLAKRLIQQQSVSMDLEEMMINKLKAACGYEFTSKLHRMYTDMAVSEGHNAKFAEYLKTNSLAIDTNFSINILQAGAWPLSVNCGFSMSLPQELEKPLQYFEQFYHKSFNGRKLTWLHHLSQGELKCCFTSRTYIITMVSYHVVIMLFFQKVDSMKLSELLSGTKLTEDAFYKFLQALIDSKMLTADTKELSPDTVISLNMSYTNKRTKFKIVGAQMKEQQIQQEVAATHSSVEEDRKMYLQAAIVRIMKTRKIIRHTDLMQEVIAQSKGRFAPQVPMIKKCIELLLDKQYIERSAGSHDEYKYVA